jgi:hypothetical protein
MIANCCFTAIPFVKEKINIPGIAMGILPLSETSKDLPPINLKTETPTPSQIKKAVEEIFTNPVYKENVRLMGEEFSTYDLNTLPASTSDNY